MRKFRPAKRILKKRRKGKKMAELFIKDKQRKLLNDQLYNRIRRGKSCLVVGEFGRGKTAFLDQIKPKHRIVIKVDSLLSANMMLNKIKSKLGLNIKTAMPVEIISELKKHKTRFLILIDEANDIRGAVYPYLKRIMNHEIPVILAAKPGIIPYLETRFGDILSRLKILNLQAISLEDYQEALKEKFESEAVRLIYSNCRQNMRIFDEIAEDCLDYIVERKIPKVTLEIATMFVK